MFDLMARSRMALALVAWALLASTATANIGTVQATDEDGGTAIDVINSNQNLWAYTVSDIAGGDVCAVAVTLSYRDDGSLTCKKPAWGTKNHIGSSIGSRWTLIEVAYLRAGTWKLLADGTSEISTDNFSQDFTVFPCEAAGNCDRRIALAAAQKYKTAAGNMALAMAGMKGIADHLDEALPAEPFGAFKTALNSTVKRGVDQLPSYLRIQAQKEADKRLKFINDIPNGPNAMAMHLLHQVVDGALEMYLDIVNDPPADYATVAEPVYEVPELTSTSPAIDALMLDIAQLAGNGAAGRKAYERYQLAAAENNEQGVHRQAAALARHNYALVAEMYDAAAGLEAFAASIEQDPDWKDETVVQADIDDLTPFINRVRADGFLPAETADLQALGFEPAQITQILTELKAVKLEEVPLNQTMAVTARGLATSLREQAPAFDEMARFAAAVGETTNTLPVASFSASPQSGAPPLQVTFTDTSTDADNTDILSASWDFGDGETATGSQVTHTFPAGVHTVTQTVSDGGGTSTAQKTITVQAGNASPVASFTATNDLLTVAVDAVASVDQDGSIVSYDWNWGDGTTTEGQTSGHTYAAPGTYTIELKVTDDMGATGVTSKQVTVRNTGPPIAVTDDLSLVGVGVIDVLANDRDPDVESMTVTVTGTPDHGSVTCSALGACRYTAATGYTGPDSFAYTVRDADGLTDVATVTITVGTPPQVAGTVVARDDSLATRAATAATVNVLANDTGTAPLTVSASTNGKHGAVSCQPGGDCTYTPEAGYSGTDGFTYKLLDAGSLTATGAVHVVVAPAGASFGASVGGGPASVTQGKEASWRVAAGAPAGATGEVLQALAAPGLTAELGGAHDLKAGSVRTARGWSSDLPGARSVHAKAGAQALLGEAASGVIPKPLPGISQGTGGDGHVPILLGSKVFAFFHHSSPTSVSCVDRATGNLCPGYPKLLTLGSGNIPGPAAVVGARIYVHLYPAAGYAQTAPIALFCWDAAADRPCGLVIVARVTSQINPGASAPVLVGGKIYFAGDTGRLYCVDPATDSPCAVPSLPTGLHEGGASGEYYDSVSHGSRVYVSAMGDKVACLDVATGSTCPGWTLPKALPSSAWNLLLRPDATGAVTGVCIAASPTLECYSNADPSTPETFTNFPSVENTYSVTEEAEAGTRTLLARHGVAGVACYDWLRMAPCTGGAYDADGGLSLDIDGKTLPSAYGAVFDNSCVVALGDPGEVFTVDPSGSSPCTSLSSGGEARTIDLRDQRCDSTVGGARWSGVTLTDAASGELGSVFVTVRDAVTGQVLAQGDIAAATLSLGAIDPALHPKISIEALAKSSAGDPAWADSVYPRIRIAWNSDPAQLCFETTTVPDCAGPLDPLSVTGRLDGLTAGAQKQLALVRAPCPPVLDPLADRAIEEQTPLTFAARASDPNGDVLTYSLIGAPVGATIDAASGGFVWTPSEAQGPGPFRMTLRVADPGGLAHERSFNIAVAEVNRPPELSPLADATLAAGRPLGVRASAVDPDLPANALTFSLQAAPAGATIDSSSGAIAWTALPGRHRFEVRVSDGSLSAQRALTVTVPDAATATDLVLGCSDRKVVLEDVVPEGSRVRLVGVADRSFAGKPVEFLFGTAGKVVAKATVAPDGSFSGTAPLPPRKLRDSNSTRYLAKIGTERSLNLKLARRMRIASIRASGGRVTITGAVIRPLAAAPRDRAIVLQRVVNCKTLETVATFKPRANGAFTVTVAAPPGQPAAVYRLRTKVRQSTRSKRSVSTFTLPRSLNF